MTRARCAADLLGVAAIGEDGLLVRDDGEYVRYLEVGSVNPLVMEQAEGERVSAAFGQLAARLPDRQSLQLYVQGTPLDLEDVLAEETHRCEQAAGAAEDAAEDERATAIRRLGIAQEHSIRATALNVAPLTLRYLVICPWRPAGRPLRSGGQSRRALRVKASVHERAMRDSLRHVEGVRSDLEAMGVPARPLDGREVLDLLHARFDPDAQLGGELPASFMCPEVIASPVAGEDAKDASARASALASAICSAELGLSERSHVTIGSSAEEVFYVSLAPEQTWLGWLLHMMQAPRPFTLSVHIQATERYRERMAQKRRYRRIHGVNRGVEQRGRPLDPDARVQEEEAAELNDELATSAGAGIYRVSIYGSLLEPGPQPDTETLHELCQAAGREVTMACDARIGHGLFAQGALWRSTLPLGRDVARRRRKYVSRNVGDTFPLCGTSCGSPEGIPLGYALDHERAVSWCATFQGAHAFCFPGLSQYANHLQDGLEYTANNDPERDGGAYATNQGQVIGYATNSANQVTQWTGGRLVYADEPGDPWPPAGAWGVCGNLNALGQGNGAITVEAPAWLDWSECNSNAEYYYSSDVVAGPKQVAAGKSADETLAAFGAPEPTAPPFLSGYKAPASTSPMLSAGKLDSLAKEVAASYAGDSSPERMQTVEGTALKSALAVAVPGVAQPQQPSLGISEWEQSSTDVVTMEGQFTLATAPHPTGEQAPQGHVLSIVLDAHTGTVDAISLGGSAPNLADLGAVRTSEAQ